MKPAEIVRAQQGYLLCKSTKVNRKLTSANRVGTTIATRRDPILPDPHPRGRHATPHTRVHTFPALDRKRAYKAVRNAVLVSIRADAHRRQRTPVLAVRTRQPVPQVIRDGVRGGECAGLPSRLDYPRAPGIHIGRSVSYDGSGCEVAGGKFILIFSCK